MPDTSDILQTMAAPPEQTQAEPSSSDAMIGAMSGNPDAVRQSNIHRRSEEARLRDESEGDTDFQAVTRDVARVLPFVKIGYNLSERAQHAGAQQRIQAGSGSDDDYTTVARYQRHLREEQEKNSTVGGRLGQTALRLPGDIAEIMLGGRIAGAAAEGIGLGGGALTQAGSFATRQAAGGTLGRFGLQLAATPSMWAETWQQNNLAEGRDSFNPRGLPAALAHGALAQAIFGQMGSIQEGVSARLGGGILGRLAGTGAAAATGIIEDQALSTVSRFAGLQTGYGSIHDLISSGGSSSAWGEVLGQALTFAAFAQMHGGADHAKEVMKDVTKTLQEASRNGVPAREAIEEVKPIIEKELAKQQEAPKAPQKAAESTQAPAGQRAVEPSPGTAAAKPEANPVREALTGMFPDAKTSPTGVITAKVGNNVFEFVHHPERNAVEFSFARASGEGGISKGLPSKESYETMDQVGRIVDQIKKTGSALEYKANEAHAGIYEAMLVRKGWEQVSGPEGKKGSLETRAWVPMRPRSAEWKESFDRVSKELRSQGFTVVRAEKQAKKLADLSFPPAEPPAQTGGANVGEGQNLGQAQSQGQNVAGHQTGGRQVAPGGPGAVVPVTGRSRPGSGGGYEAVVAGLGNARSNTPRAAIEDVKDIAKKLGFETKGSQDVLEGRIRKAGGGGLLDALVKPIEAKPENLHEEIHRAALSGDAREIAKDMFPGGMAEVKNEQRELQNDERELSRRGPERAASVRRAIDQDLSEKVKALEVPHPGEGESAGRHPGQDQGTAEAPGGGEERGEPGPSPAAGGGEASDKQLVDSQRKHAHKLLDEALTKAGFTVTQSRNILDVLHLSKDQPHFFFADAIKNLTVNAHSHIERLAIQLAVLKEGAAIHDINDVVRSQGAGEAAIKAYEAILRVVDPDANQTLSNLAEYFEKTKPAGDTATNDFFAVKPEQRNLYQEGVVKKGWIGNMPEPKSEPLYKPSLPSEYKPETPAPTAGEQSLLDRTKNPWLQEVIKRRQAGDGPLADKIVAAGGLDPNSFPGGAQGQEVKAWKEEFGDWLFKQQKNKTRQRWDEMMDPAGEIGKSIPAVPESVHILDHLYNLLKGHYTIDGDNFIQQEAHRAYHQELLDELHRSSAEKTQAEIDAKAAQFNEAADQIAESEVGREAPGETVRKATAESPPSVEQRAEDVGHFDPARIESGDFGEPLTEAERRAGSIGGGQPGAGEFRRERNLTALANAKVDAERQKAGLPPLMAAARKTNPEVWDSAMAKLEADPQAGAKLIEELARKSRTTTVEENALLLHRKIALRNEHLRAMLQVIADGKPGQHPDAATMQAHENREEELSKAIDQLDHVTKAVGTEWGRAGQFRKQLAAEDYSLQGMLQQARVAKGRELTAEERVQIGELNSKIAALQAKLDAAEDALTKSGQGAKSPVFGEWTQARLDAANVQDLWKQSLEGDRNANRPLGQKMDDLLTKVRRAFVISSPKTMMKIVAASVERLAISPLEEAAGSVWRNLPGIAKIAARAPREGRGLSFENEVKANLSAFTDGIKEAWDNVTKGKSEKDIIFGNKNSPRSWLDFPGELHAAGKAPAVAAEFTRSFFHRIDTMTAQGEDVSSPAALLRIEAEAYKDSQRAKFQQDNRVVDAWKAAIKKLQAPDASAGARALATGMNLAVPVVRIPTNLVAEAFQYAFGTVTGSVRAGIALSKGVESLKPEQADLVMRSLKKGSLGLAALGLGFFNPQMFGGYYTGNRDDRDVKAGCIRTPAGDIPSWMLHNPLLEVLQMGATMRRALNGVKKGESPDAVTAFGAGVLGLAAEVPQVREATEIARAFTARERGRFFGEQAKSLAVPQLFQWLAGQMDTNPRTGEPTRRNPQTVLQHIETGIPGLRQRVPISR